MYDHISGDSLPWLVMIEGIRGSILPQPDCCDLCSAHPVTADVVWKLGDVSKLMLVLKSTVSV